MSQFIAGNDTGTGTGAGTETEEGAGEGGSGGFEGTMMITSVTLNNITNVQIPDEILNNTMPPQNRD